MLKALIDLMKLVEVLKQDKKATNSVFWKKVQVYGTALTGGLVGLINSLDALGVEVPLSLTLFNIVTGITVICVNMYLTVATTDTLGVTPTKEEEKSDSINT